MEEGYGRWFTQQDERGFGGAVRSKGVRRRAARISKVFCEVSTYVEDEGL
jgi:hypothetical protein